MKKTEDKLTRMRHSCAHLLAAAVMELWPDTKKTIGPPIENGFYYDFDFAKPITNADLPKIEQKMRQILKTWSSFQRKETTIKEAEKILKDNPYKLELLKELEAKGIKKVSFYQSGNFLDLCEGGHTDNPKKDIGAFKLTHLAGAYWRGNEKNKMLTRIYGTCFATQKELDHYLQQLEEAKKRDHKKLGKQLGLFIIPQEVGPGLVIWTPKGALIRAEIEKFITQEQKKRGYQHVYSPHLGKKTLWQTSGHWDLYQDKMYAPLKIDEVEYLVKPMNCPMHMMVYQSQRRSYRDLPIRIAENATVYRYEQSGELAGLLRVRYITQDDAHIFCRPDQVVEEFVGVVDYIEFLMKAFQIKDFTFRLSLRDPQNKDKYLGDDQIWQQAEETITKAIKLKKASFEKKEGEAAFYGPKLDVVIKDSLGRQWQCGTVQLDFMLPARFKLTYVDQDGSLKQPVLIHRAPLGSLERFMAILIEHYGGKFPLWLAPVQLLLIPIAQRHQAYALKIKEILTNQNFRVEIDNRNETMQAKIREAQLQKIPYLGIIGDKEVQKQDVIALRSYSYGDLGTIKINDLIQEFQKIVREKR